jgi:uncharacterized ParB-like nuclease family protein
MWLEFHQLERRLEHLRVRRPERQRRLLASLAASGQQTPMVVVAAEQADRYLVIDGYQRIAALQHLGRDTVEAVVWSLSEAEALLLDRSPAVAECGASNPSDRSRSSGTRASRVLFRPAWGDQ